MKKTPLTGKTPERGYGDRPERINRSVMTSLTDATYRYTRLKNGRIRGYLFISDGRRRQVLADTVEAAQQQLADIIWLLVRAETTGVSEKTYRQVYQP